MEAQRDDEVNALGGRRARALTLQELGDGSREHVDFVALLTQELRTSLQSMLGFAQLMQRDQKEPLPERQRERMRHVLEAGDQLQRMLDDACALSRMQCGLLPLTTQAVDVIDTFQRVRAELAPLAASRQVALVIDGSDEPGPRVAADPRGLTDVLLKLANNAIAYNKPGGSVRFQVSRRAATRLRISVIDTGIGIAVAEQHELFKPFPRVSRSSASAGGSGLGLATCWRLAALMGGSVGCCSVLEQGSEFWIDLPVPFNGPSAVIRGE